MKNNVLENLIDRSVKEVVLPQYYKDIFNNHGINEARIFYSICTDDDIFPCLKEIIDVINNIDKLEIKSKEEEIKLIELIELKDRLGIIISYKPHLDDDNIIKNLWKYEKANNINIINLSKKILFNYKELIHEITNSYKTYINTLNELLYELYAH